MKNKTMKCKSPHCEYKERCEDLDLILDHFIDYLNALHDPSVYIATCDFFNPETHKEHVPILYAALLRDRISKLNCRKYGVLRDPKP